MKTNIKLYNQQMWQFLLLFNSLPLGKKKKKHLNISIKACSHQVKLLLNWETLNVRDDYADIENKNCL